ncbi:phosphoesterase family-domain-containing protein [Cyathus striatus]|nr:phosphoesterase family-domain-containing protein [Cyathus striatus]
MDNDNLNHMPVNVSSVVDLLEEKGISWAEYQEDMPSTGFPDFQFLNPTTGKNDYVRKHNPLIIYDSVANVSSRSSQIKNFTSFFEDLDNNKLPQWMFITPNMTNDGHDTDMAVAGAFSRNFLEPLLENKNFNTDRTLILLTFDENGSDDPHNRVFSILLGGAVPKKLIGTSDNNYYDHFSEISTVEANWGLHTLGRYDVGANVFDFVAKQTADKIRPVSANELDSIFLNSSYPGIFNSQTLSPMPIPNTHLVVNGRTVLPQVVATWGSPKLQRCAAYDGSLIIPSALAPPVRPAGC